MKHHHFLLSIAGLSLLVACQRIPEGITPIQNFELQPYLGTWYEIARLDHRFERGLDEVTATYALNPDGSVNVLNQGFKTSFGKWSKAEGKAKLVGDPNVGHLKVSFFGPFYASYVIFELNYEGEVYALVSGASRKYCWVLARQPKISSQLKAHVRQVLKQQGFDLAELIWVNQTGATAPTN